MSQCYILFTVFGAFHCQGQSQGDLKNNKNNKKTTYFTVHLSIHLFVRPYLHLPSRLSIYLPGL